MFQRTKQLSSGSKNHRCHQYLAHHVHLQHIISTHYAQYCIQETCNHAYDFETRCLVYPHWSNARLQGLDVKLWKQNPNVFPQWFSLRIAALPTTPMGAMVATILHEVIDTPNGFMVMITWQSPTKIFTVGPPKRWLLPLTVMNPGPQYPLMRIQPCHDFFPNSWQLSATNHG